MCLHSFVVATRLLRGPLNVLIANLSLKVTGVHSFSACKSMFSTLVPWITQDFAQHAAWDENAQMDWSCLWDTKINSKMKKKIYINTQAFLLVSLIGPQPAGYETNVTACLLCPTKILKSSDLWNIILRHEPSFPEGLCYWHIQTLKSLLLTTAVKWSCSILLLFLKFNLTLFLLLSFQFLLLSLCFSCAWEMI